MVYESLIPIKTLILWFCHARLIFHPSIQFHVAMQLKATFQFRFFYTNKFRLEGTHLHSRLGITTNFNEWFHYSEIQVQSRENLGFKFKSQLIRAKNSTIYTNLNWFRFRIFQALRYHKLCLEPISASSKPSASLAQV